jgi:Glycosyltransferase family 87
MASSTREKVGRLADLVNFLAIAVCAVVALSAYGDIFANQRFNKMRAENPIYFFDFSKYYICGKMAASEDRLNVYDAAVQGRYLVQYGGVDKSRPVEYIQYPPIDFPLMLPLAKLEISKAFNLFFLGSLTLAFLATIMLSGSELSASPESDKLKGKARIKRIAFLWLAIAGSLPLFRAFSLGQTSLFTMAMVAVYFAGLLGSSQLLAGMALALTAIKPQYTIFLVIPALACRRTKLLLTAFCTEFVLVALAASTIGIKNILDYPQIVLHADQSQKLAGVFAAQMVNWRALLCTMMNEQAAMKTSSALCLAALAALAWLWWRLMPKNDDQSQKPALEKLLVLTILTCLTTSPHTHLYDCLLLAVAALINTPFSLAKAISNQSDSAQRLLSVMLLLYPAMGWVLIYWPFGPEAKATLPFAVINVVMLILSLITVLKGKKLTAQ